MRWWEETVRAFGGRAASAVAIGLGCLGLLCARAASANGRMPGANALRVERPGLERIVVRATFGLIQSFDRGETWSWICEQTLGTAGLIADPPLAPTGDGTLVLLPPVGGALVSRDLGCTWEAAGAPLSAQRTVDLTVDPSDESRVLVLLSTVDGVSEEGYATYANRVVESRDAARSWEVLAELPGNVELETIEVAASDAARLYISGTSNVNPALGVVLRSEDGGEQWAREELQLPPGRGSMLISAIHPQDPDTLWARVPARGDTSGSLPASLFISENKGAEWRVIASTEGGMFGFALSPDGTRLAYGGPGDGLYLGPSDGSAFEKVNDLALMCLRWPSAADLYACAAQPAESFSVGRSTDDGRSFEPLYALSDTCPMTCAEDSDSARVCGQAWTNIAARVQASGAMCMLPDAGGMSPPPLDAGSSAPVDAGRPRADATTTEDAGDGDLDAARKPADGGLPARGGSGCFVARRGTWNVALAFWLGAGAMWQRQRRRRRVP